VCVVKEGKWCKWRGGAMIEFALVLPIFIVLVFGIIEFSILFYNKAVITNASREGARYGIIERVPTYATTAQIIAYTKERCEDHLITFGTPGEEPVVTATPSANPPDTGDLLTVEVSYLYTYLVLSSLLNINQTVNLTATTVMAYE
jgi:Flp pilus assembly protein TadG